MSRDSKLNMQESLLLYFACIIRGLRQHRSFESILPDAACILSAESVLIGVSESLQKISILATADKLPWAEFCLENPIRQRRSP